ncbi:MAG: prolipoprotein diacylglyceryl transferase [Gemmatales bacterium]|nr:prolipoprotein diacylglyceryl transferase [Gemmatales bacterium]MDW8386308.1 prolipoprotein diacylglyceryl transferase [Gemmatales bacterium]
MHQILFEIPTPWGRLPIFGYGFMLFLAFAVGTWLAARRAKAEGIASELIWDIATYCFIGGVLGARLLALWIDPQPGNLWQQLYRFIEIWKGGMVFYGGLIGGFLAYLIAWWRIVRPNKLSTLRIADLVMPSIALGIFFGRFGCFLNGCCYGGVADPEEIFWATRFPSNSPPQRELVSRGFQTAFGFLVDEDDPAVVGQVESGSPAEAAGLKPGDRILRVGDEPTPGAADVYAALLSWPQGKPLSLTVRRHDAGGEQTLTLAYQPTGSLPIHPTQLYNSLDGLLLFVLLTAFYPYRRTDGQVLALFLLLYPINRFLMESLRMDNPPTWFGLTLSQNISVVVFLVGLILMSVLIVRSREVPSSSSPRPSG